MSTKKEVDKDLKPHLKQDASISAESVFHSDGQYIAVLGAVLLVSAFTT